MKHTKLALSTLALVTLLAACGGGDSSSSTSTTGTTPGTRASDFSSLSQCIVNRWEMGAEQIKKGLETVGGSSASGVSFSVTGSTISNFAADGAYTSTPNFTVSFTRASTSGTMRTAGTANGNWSLANDMLTITRTSSSVVVTQTIAGSSTSYTDPVGSPSTVKVISCTPATLTYDQTLSSGAVVRIVLVSA
jgi:hypothetical protein